MIQSFDYLEIVKEVNEILKRYPGTKLTLRQIYYQLVAKHIIENNEQSYKNLSKVLVRAREEGLVDDSKIEDRSREAIGGDYSLVDPNDYYQNHEIAFKNCWSRYSRPLWFGQSVYVEIFLEKDALSRIVSGVANRYGVTTSIARGYSSYTFLVNAAKRINRHCEDGKVPIVLCFFDFDPSGVDMVRDLGDRLTRYGVPTGKLMIKRVALTKEQIKVFKLPPEPTKKGDRRAGKFIKEHGNATVELDALPPDVLQNLVKNAITEYIDEKIWQENAKQSEEEQRMIKASIESKFTGEWM